MSLPSSTLFCTPLLGDPQGRPSEVLVQGGVVRRPSQGAKCDPPKASGDPHFNRIQCSGRDVRSAVVKCHPPVVATHGVSWIVLGDF